MFSMEMLFGLVFLGAGLKSSNRPLCFASVLIIALAIPSLYAMRLTRRGETARAAMLLGCGLIATMVVTQYLVPSCSPARVVSCILAALIVLPYLQRAALRNFMAVCFVAIVFFVVHGWNNPQLFVVPTPLVFLGLVVGVPVITFYIFLLMRQFSERQERLLAAERAAFEEATRAKERAAYLAEASVALAGSLDLAATLEKVSELATMRLCDWCTISVLREDGGFERVSARHRDPDKAKRVLALAQDDTYPPAQKHAIYLNVLETGRTFLAPNVTEEDLIMGAQNDEQARSVAALGIGSVILAPIRLQNRSIGIMSLVHSQKDAYSPEDVETAQELANRAALAVENARLYAKERRAVQVRDDFLHVAGHELRTPLTALVLQMRGLDSYVGRQPESRAGDFADRLRRTGATVERLARLVDELLDVSRILGGKLALEPESVDLVRVVEDVTARLSEAASAHHCSLLVRSPSSLVGRWDQLRIEHVVTNLLTNAIKYGSGHPIELDVEQSGDSAVLRVRDHGIGIDAEDQQRIFERFERAVTTRHYGGLGLGLWITRQAVEASGGKILVESKRGEGASFSVTLPIAGPPGPAAPRN
jgi:signal transduction histidine kinase